MSLVPQISDYPWLDRMGAFVAFTVMVVFAFTQVAPYFVTAVDQSTIDLIKSNKSTSDLIATAVVMFYFGASVGRRKDQETLGTLVNTNAAAQAALAPLPSTVDAIPISPGEVKTVVGTDQ